MDLPWADIAKVGGGTGGAFLTMMAVYFGAKYLRTRNGKAEPAPRPECPARSFLEDTRIELARYGEGFKGLCHSIDGMAEAIRDNTQEQKAVVGSLLNAYLKKEAN